MRVRAKSLGFGGDCVCHSEGDAPGKVIFAPGLVPEELADVAIIKEEKNVAFGAVEQLIEPSPFRQSPPCVYYGSCGGCNLQHMTTSKQRSEKLRMIEGMLNKQGGVVPEKGINNLSETLPDLYYRKRGTLHIDAHGRIGFYRAGTGDVVEIETCVIASKSVNDVIAQLRPFAKQCAQYIGSIEIDVEDDVWLTCKVRDGFSIGDLEKNANRFAEIATLGDVTIRVRGKEYQLISGKLVARIDGVSGHFSQVNPYGNEILVRSVIEGCAYDTVTELYAGSGNFTLPLAQSGRSVIAVELDEILVKESMHRVTEAGLEERVKLHSSSCEAYVERHNLTEVVVLDPPRAGAKEVIRKGKWGTVKQIIYISCNLPSLTRDLKSLVGSGFNLEKVDFVDMFPQTHHVELIAWLHRAS